MSPAARQVASPQQPSGSPADDQAGLPRKSRWLYQAFTRYSRRLVCRHFDALRLAEPGFPSCPANAPVLVYLNHPSWWDPLIALTLADAGFGKRSHYAPIDEAALRQYAFFAKLGFFGIDRTTTRGKARFLRLGRRALARPERALWVTAEGHFTDPRQRPVTLQPGVAHLARRLPQGIILPLALEYPFWQEKRPEALACFGEPIRIGQQPDRDVTQWHEHLTAELEQAVDRLSRLAMRQNARDWRTIVSGRIGTSPTYDFWRAMRARLRGERFHRAHTEATRDA
jgi:1-acyl-sn-glycerol-3-phosphate acyltransferase